MGKELEKIKEIMSDPRLNTYLDDCLDAEKARKKHKDLAQKAPIGWGMNAEIFAGYLDRIRKVLGE